MSNNALLEIAFCLACVSDAFPTERAAIPDFAPDNFSSWVPVSDDYLPPPSGPGPLTFDKAHPYAPNFSG
jgi:hypothetical protein